MLVANEPSRVEFANALRGVAALLVVISHHIVLFWTDRTVVTRFTGLPTIGPEVATPYPIQLFADWAKPIEPGQLGVSIFFLISGFVIPFAFERRSRREFVWARFFRIWPTYFAGFLITLSAVLLASHFSGAPLPFPAQAILPHMFVGLRALFQTQSIDGIVWTLEVEVAFYILALSAAPLLRHASWKAFFVPAIICFAVIALYEVRTRLGADVSAVRYAWKVASFTPYLVFIFVGVALNFRYRRDASLALSGLTILSLLAAAGVLVSITTNNLSHIAPSYACGLAVFLAAMALPTFRTPRIVAFFADISYPLYVVHCVAGYALLWTLISKLGLPAFVALPCVFGVVVLIAWILHVAIEQPCLAIGRNTRWLESRPLPQQS